LPEKLLPETDPVQLSDCPPPVVPLKRKPSLVALPLLDCVPSEHANVAAQPDCVTVHVEPGEQEPPVTFHVPAMLLHGPLLPVVEEHASAPATMTDKAATTALIRISSRRASAPLSLPQRTHHAASSSARSAW
jgi:hypothetical protein